MERSDVESSMLKSVGYDCSTSVLEVEFYKGTIYQYMNVPVDVYEELMSAESVGKAFIKLVKSQGYSYAASL